MGDSYDKALEAVRQLRDLGAVRVRVGDVEAEFPPQAPQAFLAELPVEEPDPLETRQRWEEEQYLSSGPVDPALLRRLGVTR